MSSGAVQPICVAASDKIPPWAASAFPGCAQLKVIKASPPRAGGLAGRRQQKKEKQSDEC